jgi:hypothetical protein
LFVLARAKPWQARSKKYEYTDPVYRNVLTKRLNLLNFKNEHFQIYSCKVELNVKGG